MAAAKLVYHRSNYLLSTVAILAAIASFSLFITYMLLLSTNQQFIAFNEYSATGKYPAMFFYVALLLCVLYAGLFFVSLFAVWASVDVLNRWNTQVRWLFALFITSLLLAGLVQLAAGLTVVVYAKTMPEPLREYMADNLRSNYTGGFGNGYLDTQFDRSVDWVQINYQCCGVVSYEDFRNGFYYNSFNKYTIVSIVPNSCCIYRDQAQPTKCQMKSVNIFRKGCYDILMWWMDTFGVLISALTFAFAALSFVAALIYVRLYKQIGLYLQQIDRKQTRLAALHRKAAAARSQADEFAAAVGDTSTLNETISCVETTKT